MVVYLQSAQGCSTGTENNQTNSINPSASSFDLLYKLGFSQEIYESSQCCTNQQGWKLHKNPAQRGILKNPLGHCCDKVLSLAQDPYKALSDPRGCSTLLCKQNWGYSGIANLTNMLYLYVPPPPPANFPPSCHAPEHLMIATWRLTASKSNLDYTLLPHLDSKARTEMGQCWGSSFVSFSMRTDFKKV